MRLSRKQWARASILVVALAFLGILVCFKGECLDWLPAFTRAPEGNWARADGFRSFSNLAWGWRCFRTTAT